MTARTWEATASPIGKAARSAPSLLATVAFVLFALVGSARAVEVQQVVSKSGIKAWLVEDDTLPLVAMSFAFVGGAAQDPLHLPGVANMLSGLLDEGAGALDSEAFQAALDESAIELSFDADRDTFGGSLRTLVENQAQATALLRLALTEPRFDREPVERVRAQIVAGIRRGERDPDSVAGEALIKAAFPDHPYGLPVEGTLETVSAITVDDLRTYHGKSIARDNLKIAVVGAIDAATLAELLDEAFGSLPVKANLDLVRDVEPAVGERIDIAMNIPQTVLRFAGRGVVRDDPDFIAAAIALRILGGGSFSSRLYEEVREKRGLAYSIGFRLRPYDHAGLVVGSTRTRADQADRVVDLIESEVTRFATDGATDEELASAKSYLIGSFALRFTTSTRIAGQLLAIQLDGLGIDYIDRRNDLIAAVTIDDIRRVTRRLLGGELTVVRVGQPAS
jgi:zinc protease